MDSTKAEYFELIAELERVKESTEVDEEIVKDLEKRLIEYVEKNKVVIYLEHLEVIESLKMDKLLKVLSKISSDLVAEIEDSSPHLMLSGDKKKKD